VDIDPPPRPYRDDLERILDFGRLVRARAEVLLVHRELEACDDGLVPPAERPSEERVRLGKYRLRELDRVVAETTSLIELRSAEAPASKIDALVAEHGLDEVEHEILFTLAAVAIDPKVDDALRRASEWQTPRGHVVGGLVRVVGAGVLRRQLGVLHRLTIGGRLSRSGLITIDAVRAFEESARLWARDATLSAGTFVHLFGAPSPEEDQR